MEKYVVGTLTKSEIEADPRDFKADAVLPNPTDTDLKNLPKAFSLGMYVGETYYQNGRWSCTALWTCHSMQIQNVQELLKNDVNKNKQIIEMIWNWKNPISLIREDLRTKMGHNLDDKKDSWDYVEKALNTCIKQGIKWKDFMGVDITYFGSSFAYKRDDVDWEQMLKYYLTKYPCVMVIKGTNKTWQEMTAGEVKTIMEWFETTGAHCICCVGYDEYWIRFLNSWSKNSQSKTKSVFRISWENHKKMIELWMINWRFWVLFDKEEAVVDLEKLKEENNMTELLKLLNKSRSKTSIKEVQNGIGDLGKLIRDNYPNANKAVPK